LLKLKLSEAHATHCVVIRRTAFHHNFLCKNTQSPGIYLKPLVDMYHLSGGISSRLHSVNLILFTLLLVHLILRISPHHSHHLRSHHLSLPRLFTPDSKLISFTNPFLLSGSFRTALMDLNLCRIKWALTFVYFSLFFYTFLFLATCARLS